MSEEPTYVLIPGAGGAAWYWHRVVAELQQRGRPAVAVDLPGDDDTVGLPEYADAVVAQAGGAKDVVLVAQSMGAFTALEVFDRQPVSLLVLVNAMIPLPGETPGEWWGNTNQAQAMRDNDAREGRPADAPFDLHTYFLHEFSQAEIDESWQYQREESAKAFGSPLKLSAWPAVPTRVIAGRDDRFFPAEFQRRVSQERLGITPDVIPGGHLVALSQPVTLVDLLESYRADHT
jgi:pimeloyl-ACP methyl ester carboxylesterase